ncbi:TPA: FkbM family methyltransferase [Yersinia enterocolitica]|uniref:FkbM family methyltransferase n=1 Tax=Yersinia enterocolitica TaxID=630 RepID=UPI00227C6B44|nr:FkbM family methyltransferase [Yersinia enterocolitica]EKN5912850.1 FkbM family methyltransferase [Yersinia enterocolitica]MCY1686353.1 FkbM family methyltransferase [Yersinia enterocolitica]HDM8434391.1 FkbM family methyltransferase [Yersinia enterocolitica]HDW8043138.1 FkbM family methyltransferase [Yersinia enterocolitica]HEM6611712.1 FkbM family methyltransferase [Yersinia enterocolitica]
MEEDQLNQALDIKLLQLLSQYCICRYFLDVGAEKGSIAKTLYEQGFCGDLIDPLSKHASILSALAEQYGGHFFQLALADTDGARPFYIAEDNDGRELDYFHSLQPIEPQVKFSHQRNISVQCRRIDGMVMDGLLPNNMGILKVDTEGNDYFVLAGLGDIRPELVICEFFQELIYSGWEFGRAEIIIQQMRELGYRRYYAIKRFSKWTSLVAGPAAFKSQDWGNLFFMKDTLFERSEQAVIALMLEIEQKQFNELDALHADWQAKELVIQGLLKDKNLFVGRAKPKGKFSNIKKFLGALWER